MSAVVTKLNLPSMRERVSAEEWDARVQLAACYRLGHHFGWQGTNFGTHLSARVPDEPGHFLLMPVGLWFDEITASSLIKVDMDGKKLNDSPYRVNGGGAPCMAAAIWRAQRSWRWFIRIQRRGSR